MLNKSWWTPFVLVVWLMSTGVGFSQDEPSGRPCSEGDVMGTWSLVRIRPLIPAPEGDPDFLPYQVWVFTPGAKFIKMGKPTPITESEYRPFVEMTASNPELLGTTYRVIEQNALVTLQPEGATTPYHFSCFVLTNDFIDAQGVVDMRVGDILLDLRAMDGKTLIGHHFRKVRLTDE